MGRTTRRGARVTATLAVVVCLLAACGDAQGPAGRDGTEPTTDAPTASPAPATPTPPTSLEPTSAPGAAPGSTDARVAAAVADLAEHLGVAQEDVTVVSVEEVTWPDGALGCPEPGMAYTQALVPGSRLVLEVDGVSYFYHGAAGAELVRCDRTPQPPVPSG